MESADTRYRAQREASAIVRTLRGAMNFSWHAVRLPLLAILSLLEPVVCFVLAGLAILGIMVALFRELAGSASGVPLWGMLTFSGGALALLALYYALIRLLSR